jgi:hypothetical protein
LGFLALGLVVLGAACRVVRYLRAPALWCDEVFITLPFVGAGRLDLTRPTEFCQIAPVLFLWLEHTAYRLLGASEWALRLLPLLAGLASLPLFWRLARTTLPPLPATLATGVLVTARWPMAMSNLVKPYSCDLVFSLVLLNLAADWLGRPDRRRPLLLLAVLGPVAALASFPVVFVAASVSLALAAQVWRQGGRSLALFLVYNALVAAGFAVNYHVGQCLLGPESAGARAYYQEFWERGFPPASPWPLACWMLRTHTGEMMAYPAGDRNGVSTLTFFLFLGGIWWCWENRPRVLPLCLLPFGLGLAASALRCYPYGAEPRLDQYLAPGLCLLVGAGLAAVVGRLGRSERAVRGGAVAACAVLACCGVAVSFMGTSKPASFEKEAAWAREAAGEVGRQAGAGDQVVVLAPPHKVLAVLRWQLTRLGPRLAWDGRVDWPRLERTGGRLWVVGGSIGSRGEGAGMSPEAFAADVSGLLGRGGRKWALAGVSTSACKCKGHGSPPVGCYIAACVRQERSQARLTPGGPAR